MFGRKSIQILFPIFLVTLLITSVPANTQTQPKKMFTESWKKIDSLCDKGRPRDALNELEKVYEWAVKENNQPILIKSLIYRTGILSTIGLNPEPTLIAEIEEEAAKTRQPARAVLQTLLAIQYQQYWQNNRWEIMRRTPLQNQNSSDITTWTAIDFHKKITFQYLLVLANSEQLKSIPVSQFDGTIVKGNVRKLRPTLFDFLAAYALEYFRQKHTDLPASVNDFRIADPGVFAPAAEFAAMKFPDGDSLSTPLLALKFYQELISFHLNDKNPAALIDIDIARLEFLRNESSVPNREALWVKAIEHITSKYGQLPAASQAWYLLAEYHHGLAQTYHPDGDTTNRFAKRKALEICQQVILQKDSSEGKYNCINLARDIQQRELEIKTELVNLPGDPMRSLVSFRNIESLEIRVVPVTIDLRRTLEDLNDEDSWEKLTAIKPITTFSQKLPHTGDYQTHRVEIATPALPIGDYALLVSDGPGFSTDTDVLAVQYFHVSEIAFIEGHHEIYVVNRRTGKPLAGARIDLWEEKYSTKRRTYELKKVDSLVTAKNGLAKLDPKNNEFGQISIQYGRDKLHILDEYYRPYWKAYEKLSETETIRTYLFTDRDLYRPGQTIFLKGLKTKERGIAETVVAGASDTLCLYDANGKEIDSAIVSTNGFGSYTTSFKLPQGRLNGMFRVSANDGTSVYFRVEEYKRPTFTVSLDKPTETYRLNDTVTIRGNAVAFAGNSISNAKVSYRVVRNPNWRVFYMRRGGIYPTGNRTEITNGVVNTDIDGNFSFRFPALAEDNSNNPNPYFDFSISVDVTDINGETHSTNLSLVLGKKGFLISLNHPPTIAANQFKQLNILAENSGGIPQEIPSEVEIYRLKTPGKSYRTRYWEAPDMQVIPETEYRKMFPLDEYADELNVEKWPEEKLVYRSANTTTKTGIWPGEPVNLPEGWYAIKIKSTAANGETVELKDYVRLTGKNFYNPHLFVDLENRPDSVNVGQTLDIRWSSNMKNLNLIREIRRSSKNKTAEWISVRSKSLKLPVADSTQESLVINLLTVKDNRFYAVRYKPNIVNLKKQLLIETTSFRDKTLPGSNETWSVSIKPAEGAIKPTEVLSTMYDASLDEIYKSFWSLPGKNISLSYDPESWVGNRNFRDVTTEFSHQYDTTYETYHYTKIYDKLVPPPFERQYMVRMMATGTIAEVSGMGNKKYKESASSGIADTAEGTAEETAESTSASSPVQVRTNFNETAFFYPQLVADEEGNLSFSFTMPESLTKWKWRTFAHTAGMAYGFMEKTMITQKNLMVQANLPRFLREGDRIELSARISNLTDRELTGQIELQLLDADTRQPVDGWFQNSMPNQYFTAAAGGSTANSFAIQIPYQYTKPLVVRFMAKAGQHSDGEEIMLPVLSNRMLVTETQPISMHGSGEKKISWEKLKQSGSSETLQHQSLTVEYTANPAWLIVQTLPYLAEQKNASSEQLFARFYANSMAAGILAKAPRIREVIRKWSTTDTSALLSALQKNNELKSILQEETPWVLEAEGEAETKRRLATLIDLKSMQQELSASLEELAALQSGNGSFPWFPDGPDNLYITQHIVTGLGHLRKTGMLPEASTKLVNAVVQKAMPYLDQKFTEAHQQLLKRVNDTKDKRVVPGPLVVNHLYMRSFFPEIEIPKEDQTAFHYFNDLAWRSWTKLPRYEQAIFTIALQRNNETAKAKQILESLKQFATRDEENGMYWKDIRGGYYWYQSPLTAQAALIEAFAESGNYSREVADMKTWLIRKKRGTLWSSSIATANACYALLLKGDDFTEAQPKVTVELGSTPITADSTEAGTGYFKSAIAGTEVKSEMGNIRISVSGTSQPSWGGIYWQYFEQLDKIRSADAGKDLSIERVYYVEKNHGAGPVLEEINNTTFLHPGDRVVVRVIIRTKQDLEFVHLRDQRGSGLEPEQTLSGFRFGAPMHYRSVKDASTQFFFDWLPIGTHVLEYRLFVTHAGTFSTGISTIQCLYAPEFAAHSEGIILRAEN